MPFKIDTQMKGVYVISEDSIAHYFFQKEETSPGLLVKKHYSEVEKVLYAAWYIREGKCYESIAAYWHEENDLKDAPPLEKVVAAIEKHLDLFTEGGYQKCVAAHEKQDWKLMGEKSLLAGSPGNLVRDQHTKRKALLRKRDTPPSRRSQDRDCGEATGGVNE